MVRVYKSKAAKEKLPFAVVNFLELDKKYL
jgi:hypothetical protein